MSNTGLATQPDEARIGRGLDTSDDRSSGALEDVKQGAREMGDTAAAKAKDLTGDIRQQLRSQADERPGGSPTPFAA
jgi:hypothetical protein